MKTAFIAFDNNWPEELAKNYDVVITQTELEEFIEPGSIYEASAFVKELSLLKLDNGKRLTKSRTFYGYELWWLYYNSIFTYFCLPYTKYRKLLEHLKNFGEIFFYHPPYKILFSYYLSTPFF